MTHALGGDGRPQRTLTKLTVDERDPGRVAGVVEM